MKKCLTAMALGLLVCATAAHAEQKLLVTEILDPGQMEAEASFEAGHSEADFTLGAETGTLKISSQETRFSLGVGVIDGLEVSASLPYVLNEKEKESLATGESASSDREGFGDLTLGAKYRLVEQGEQPYSLVVGLDVKFDTASEARGGTGSNDVSPYLAISSRQGEHCTPYAAYRATLADQGESDEHALTFGVESELSEKVTLDMLVTGSLHTATDVTESFESYGAEVAAYLDVAPNLYLIPSVGVERSTSVDGKGGAADLSVDAATSYLAGLSIYYLY